MIREDLRKKEGEALLGQVAHDVEQWERFSNLYFDLDGPGGRDNKNASYLNKLVHDGVTAAIANNNPDITAISAAIPDSMREVALRDDIGRAMRQRLERMQFGRALPTTIDRFKLTVLEEGVEIVTRLPYESPLQEFRDYRILSYGQEKRSKAPIGTELVKRVAVIDTLPTRGGAIVTRGLVGRMAIMGLVDKNGNPRVELEALTNR